jgi:hypothetical protein
MMRTTGVLAGASALTTIPPVRRAILLLLVFSACGFGEDAIPFRLDYEGGNLGLAPGVTNDLFGGVHAWYGGAHLHADRLTWIMSPATVGGQEWLEHLDVLSGDHGPQPHQVLIDTTQAALLGLGFRGQLRPQSVKVERQPADPGMPGQIRWKVALAAPGWFAGDLLFDEVWIPHGGWAHEIVVDLVAQDQRDLSPRCQNIHLYGMPATEGTPARRCRLDRLRTALASPEALADQPPTAAEFAMEAGEITIMFNDQGGFNGLNPAGATSMYGNPPRGLRLRQHSGLGSDDSP